MYDSSRESITYLEVDTPSRKIYETNEFPKGRVLFGVILGDNNPSWVQNKLHQAALKARSLEMALQEEMEQGIKEQNEFLGI